MKILTNKIDELAMKIGYSFEKTHDDQQVNTLLNFWKFFDKREQEIQEITGIQLEVILYSKYYWCTRYKEKYNQLFGVDEGLDQQQYRIIEEINHRTGSVNWKLIQTIEEDLDEEEIEI